MKKKKIHYALISAVFLFAIGAFFYSLTNSKKETLSNIQYTDSDTVVVAKIGDQEFSTLKEALASVSNGETIILLDDVTENVSSKDVNYTLDMQGHTITGTGTTVTYYINGGTVSIFNGTIKGGNYKYGGGFYFYGNSDITLKDITVTDNKSTNGGGIYAYTTTLRADNLTVTNNSATYGGGIYVNGSAKVYLTNSDISYNTVTSSGGGIYTNGELELANTTFEGNSAKWGGWNLYLSNHFNSR